MLNHSPTLHTPQELDAARTFYGSQMIVEDVTENDEKCRAAFEMVAATYAQFSSRGVDTQEVYAELCRDAYHMAGAARTFALYGLNPNSEEPVVELLATIRMVLGMPMPDGLYPLEAMHLVSPQEGWENFTFGGFDPYKAVEYGRLVISPACRKEFGREMGITDLIMRQLLIRSFATAASKHDRSQAWVIMPSYVVKTVLDAGFTVSQAPDIGFEYEANRSLFEKYDRYWLNRAPGYYRLGLDFVYNTYRQRSNAMLH